MRKMIHFSIAKLSGFFLGIVFVGLCVAGYWVFTGRDALVIHNEPLPAKPKYVKSEQDIELTASFCKTTDVSGRVTRRLVSNQTELLAPTVPENTAKGCYQDLPIKVPIPPQTTPGIYYVNYRVVYKTNPFHTITVEFNSEEFEVIE